METILALVWLGLGLAMMILSKDLEIVIKCFMVSGLFFISTNITMLRLDLTKRGKRKDVDKTQQRDVQQ